MLATLGDVFTPPVMIAMVAALFGGGGIVAIYKAKPEAGKVIVDAAAGAVIVQGSVIKALQEQHAVDEKRIDVLEREVGALKKMEQDLSRVTARLQVVTEERDRLRLENNNYLERIGRLEARIEQLEKLLPKT